MHRDSNDVSETASTDEKTALESEPLPQSKPDTRLQLDTGEEHVRIRLKWWQLWIPKDPPPPPRNSLSDAPVIPVASVSLISMLTYTWITPLMTLGYQRTLQASDLWKMDDSRSSATLSTKLDKSWTVRLEKAKTWNDKLEAGLISPGFYKRGIWVLKSLLAGRRFSDQLSTYEQAWRKGHGRKHASLALALNDTFGLFFWSGGIFKVFGDTAQLMGPLLVKAIINFAKHRAAAIENGTNPPNIGIGIAMAFGLFFITIMASVTQHQFFWRSMITGILSRAALISAIYKRGVNLSGKARTQLTNSDLMNHISTDVSRIDACAQWFHAGWTAPVQVTVCLIILLTQLGPSALAGFALFLCIAPIQERVMAHQFKVRKQSMKFTDRRAKTLLEVLGSMRVVKYFSYEEPFLDRISNVRADELDGIRRIQNLQSAK
ncbi:ABC transporter transmembrane region-domain-containing protein [Crucibulum laeve]|uniref:ABC transporter transmembrane region-domain-containing protein n=1 Tax=Crucibulum laeve TaxID=68775 RepID=A0A5C3M4F7_9AGAR|nr:ABC transporter transmembrane region-domain-containing protein [Crucibulum laeve]